MSLRRPMLSTSALCYLALMLHSPFFANAQTSIMGFTPSAATHETGIENKFKAIPSPDEERRQHKIFTASRTLPDPRATTNWLATSPTNGATKGWRTL